MTDTYVLVRVDAAEVAFSRTEVAEILPLARLDRAPGAPRSLAGFMNLGGQPLPVLRLGVLLGGEPPASDDVYSHVVRLRPQADRASVGVLVDRVLDAAASATATEAVSPDESLNGVVAETLTLNGRFVRRLDAARLLLAEEAARLAALTEAASARLAEWSAA